MSNQTHHVLLVEDDDDHAMLMELQLSRVDFIKGLDRVADGVEALEWLASQDEFPDLILLDLNLPRLSGDQFLRIIRDSDDTRDLPVVVVTSSNNAHDAEQVRRLAVVDVLVKPVSAQQLGDAIASIPPQVVDPARPQSNQGTER
jgi:CheY-like chemotaxis protein